MGTVMSTKNILIFSTVAAVAAFSIYGISKYCKTENLDDQLLKDIEDIGSVRINHDRSMPYDKLSKVKRIIHKYIPEFRKFEKQQNLDLRIQLLKSNDLVHYIYAIIEGNNLEEQSRRNIESKIFNKLAINQEVYTATIKKYQKDPRFIKLQKWLNESDAGNCVNFEQAKNICNFGNTVIAEYKNKEFNKILPNSLIKELQNKFGTHWENTVLDYIAADKIYDKFGIEQKQLSALMIKYEFYNA